MLKEEERKAPVKHEELWIDIGASDKQDAASVIRIGDPVTLELGYQEMRNNLANSPGMDNRTGLWVVIEALRRASSGSLKCALFAVSTVQEEVGLRGVKTSAFAIDPQLGIAVDVTHATDCPTVSEAEHGRVALGEGPVVFRGPNINPVVFSALEKQAQEHDIPRQINGISKPAGNDGNALQISRAGVATGIIGIPNRYMHSPVEVISLDDLDNAAELIFRFCLSVDRDSDFTP